MMETTDGYTSAMNIQHLKW